jgi:hypothetical protein
MREDQFEAVKASQQVVLTVVDECVVQAHVRGSTKGVNPRDIAKHAFPGRGMLPVDADRVAAVADADPADTNPSVNLVI